MAIPGFNRPPETEIYQLNPQGYFYRPKSRREYPGSHGFLHRIVWMETNGEIPDGCDIHHVDENQQNNVSENLDAIEVGAHLTHHRTREREIRCVNCSTVFIAKIQHAKYCSNACKFQYGRQHYGWKRGW